MCGSVYKNGKFTWVHDVRANFVCIRDNKVVAYVLVVAWDPWQIILCGSEGNCILQGELFDDPRIAMSRAEEVIQRDGRPPHPRFLQRGNAVRILNEIQ